MAYSPKTTVGWVVGLVFVFLVAASFAQTPAARARTSASTGKYRIAGAVVDAGNGEMVGEAVVSIGRSQSTETLQSVRTGEDGRFQFEGLEAGKYWLKAEARGYAQQGFEEHEGFFTGIVTGATVDAEHLMFRLRPDAAISGDVIDEVNEAVRDAQVILLRRQMQDGREVTGWFSTATTNDEGHYRFGHLQPGTYFVAVRAHPWYAQNQQRVQVSKMVRSVEGSASDSSVAQEGMTLNAAEPEEPSEPENEDNRALDVAYPVTFYPEATEESGASPLVLKAGARATADFRLTAVPAVHVRLTVPGVGTGEGQRANVMQKLFDSPPQPVQGQIMAGDKGETEISGIAPGEYEVEVQTFGKNPATWSEHVSLQGDADLTLTPGSAATVAAVKGVVKMEGGVQKTPRGTFVQLWNRAMDKRYATQVGENGEFDFSPQEVVPGKYEVEAGGPTRGRVSRIAAGGAKVEGQNVEIGGAGTVQLTITLGRGFGTVNGIAMRDGKPFAGAMVVLVPQDLENNLPLVRRDQSDLDGTFTLGSVVPGKYTVIAIEHGWELDWMSSQVLDGYLKGGESVTVGAEKKYEVKVGVE